MTTLAGFKYVEASMYKRFMEQIVAEPHKDLPRLLLCDWLEGDVDDAGSRRHARFIRTQFALEEQRDPARRPPASPENDRLQDELLATEKLLFQTLPLWTLYGRPKPKQITLNPVNVHRTEYPWQGPALLCRKGFFTELLCDGRWLSSGQWPKLRKKCPITDVWMADRDYPNLSPGTETKLDGSVTLHHRAAPRLSDGLTLEENQQQMMEQATGQATAQLLYQIARQYGPDVTVHRIPAPETPDVTPEILALCETCRRADAPRYETSLNFPEFRHIRLLQDTIAVWFHSDYESDMRSVQRHVFQYECFVGRCDRCRTVTVRMPRLAYRSVQTVPRGA